MGPLSPGANYHLFDQLTVKPSPCIHREPFGSLEAAKRFLALNGMAKENIIPIDADHLDSSMAVGFHLVISIQAWCFHFPGRLSRVAEARVRKGAAIILTSGSARRRGWPCPGSVRAFDATVARTKVRAHALHCAMKDATRDCHDHRRRPLSGNLKDPPRGIGIVIGVNESMLRSHCQFGVSMDRLFMEHRWWEIKRRSDVLTHVHARRAALANIKERPDWLHPFECDHKEARPTEEEGRLNGTNSGLCALNLAFKMRPAVVLLIGFDMDRSPAGRAYWWGDEYPWAKPGAPPRAGSTGPGRRNSR